MIGVRGRHSPALAHRATAAEVMCAAERCGPIQEAHATLAFPLSTEPVSMRVPRGHRLDREGS